MPSLLDESESNSLKKQWSSTCPSFWSLGLESRDFSHAEKERTASKAEQTYKMTIISTQNGPRLLF